MRKIKRGVDLVKWVEEWEGERMRRGHGEGGKRSVGLIAEVEGRGERGWE